MFAFVVRLPINMTTDLLGGHMRTIQAMVLTSLVLVGLAGIGSYYATHSLHDATSGNDLLFGLSWIFSALGVACAAAFIGLTLSYGSFGSRELLVELFSVFVAGMILIAFGCGVAAFFLCQVSNSTISDPLSTTLDSLRFAAVYIGMLGGFILGYLAILAINGRKHWFHNLHGSKMVRIHYGI
jgi:hypothetical protein